MLNSANSRVFRVCMTFNACSTQFIWTKLKLNIKVNLVNFFDFHTFVKFAAEVCFAAHFIVWKLESSFLHGPPQLKQKYVSGGVCKLTFKHLPNHYGHFSKYPPCPPIKAHCVVGRKGYLKSLRYGPNESFRALRHHFNKKCTKEN